MAIVRLTTPPAGRHIGFIVRFLSLLYFMTMESPIKIDPQVMSGTPCFTGTRVPVDILFDLLRRGRTVEQFLTDFPSVTRPQVDEVLKLASADVLQHALRVGAA